MSLTIAPVSSISSQPSWHQSNRRTHQILFQGLPCWFVLHRQLLPWLVGVGRYCQCATRFEIIFLNLESTRDSSSLGKSALKLKEDGQSLWDVSWKEGTALHILHLCCPTGRIGSTDFTMLFNNCYCILFFNNIMLNKLFSGIKIMCQHQQYDMSGNK